MKHRADAADFLDGFVGNVDNGGYALLSVKNG